MDLNRSLPLPTALTDPHLAEGGVHVVVLLGPPCKGDGPGVLARWYVDDGRRRGEELGVLREILKEE